MASCLDEEFARHVLESGAFSPQDLQRCRLAQVVAPERLLAEIALTQGLLTAERAVDVLSRMDGMGRLGSIAVERGLLSLDQLEECERRQRETPSIPLARVILETSRFDAAQLTALLRQLDRRLSGPRKIGRYFVKSLLGQGGMSDVYLALDGELDREVALKLLRASGAAERALVERFHREAQNVARLKHPAIVTVYEAGRDEDTLYIAMEHVAGLPLTTWKIRKDPPRKTLLAVLEEVARAVHYAHQRGVVHRDLKPTNILMDAQDRPHIVDFGISRAVDTGEAITTAGTTLGTPHYMPPEQIVGDVHHIDARTDVYALGVMLYELLTGYRPFDGDTPMAIYQKALECDPPPLRKAPPDLAVICLKAMQKERERRYASAEVFADDLRRHLNGEPIQAKPDSVLLRVARRVRRRAWPVALAAVVVFLGGIAAVLAAANRRTQRKSQTHLAILKVCEEAFEDSRTEGGLERALTRLDEALARLGEHAPLLVRRAALRYEANRLDEAASDADRAIAIAPAETEAHLIRGKILLRRHQDSQGLIPPVDPLYPMPEREGLRRDALASFARAASWDFAQAAAAAYEGRPAEESLTRCLQSRPQDADAYALRALVRVQADDPPAALHDLDQAIRIRPSFAAAHVGRAVVRLIDSPRRPEHLRAALADLDRASQIAPDCAVAHAHRASLLLALAKLGDGDPAQQCRAAIAAAGRAFELRPDHIRARWQRGVGHLTLANLLPAGTDEARREFELAAVDFDALRESGLEPAEILILRGTVYAGLGRWMELSGKNPAPMAGAAHADFSAALEIQPDSIEALVGRASAGRMLARREVEPEGRLRAALSDLDRLIALAPRHMRGRHERGLVREELARWAGGAEAPILREGAIEDLDEALLLGAPTAESLAARGRAHYRLGRYGSAAADWERAIELEPALRGDLEDLLREAKGKR
ncbi:MAG: protein kinase [Planctomycetes bacterium]|nr:protein kinase [Planctomycetota bacterium]